MGTFSIWHILVVLVLFMLLFGRGKISDVMGDVAKGVKAFKKGLSEDEVPATKSVADTREPQEHAATEDAPKH